MLLLTRLRNDYVCIVGHAIRHAILMYFLYEHLTLLYRVKDEWRVVFQSDFVPPVNDTIAITLCLNYELVLQICPHLIHFHKPKSLHSLYECIRKCDPFNRINLIVDQENRQNKHYMNLDIGRSAHHWNASHMSFGLYCGTFHLKFVQLLHSRVAFEFRSLKPSLRTPIQVYVHDPTEAPQFAKDFLLYFTKFQLKLGLYLNIQQIEYDEHIGSCRSYTTAQRQQCRTACLLSSDDCLVAHSLYLDMSVLQGASCNVTVLGSQLCMQSFWRTGYTLKRQGNCCVGSLSNLRSNRDFCRRHCSLPSCFNRRYSIVYLDSRKTKWRTTIEFHNGQRFKVQITFNLTFAFTLLTNSIAVLFGLSMLDLMPAVLRPMLLLYRQRFRQSQLIAYARFGALTICCVGCSLQLYPVASDFWSNRSRSVVEMNPQFLLSELTVSLCFELPSLTEHKTKMCKRGKCWIAKTRLSPLSLQTMENFLSNHTQVIRRFQVNRHKLTSPNSEMVRYRHFIYRNKKCIRLDIRFTPKVLQPYAIHSTLNKYELVIQTDPLWTDIFLNDYGNFPNANSLFLKFSTDISLKETWHDCNQIDCFSSNSWRMKRWANSFDCVDECMFDEQTTRKKRLPSLVPYTSNRFTHLKSIQPPIRRFDGSVVYFESSRWKQLLRRCNSKCGRPAIDRTFVKVKKDLYDFKKYDTLQVPLSITKTTIRPQSFTSDIRFCVSIFGIFGIWFGISFLSLQELLDLVLSAAGRLGATSRLVRPSHSPGRTHNSTAADQGGRKSDDCRLFRVTNSASRHQELSIRRLGEPRSPLPGLRRLVSIALYSIAVVALILQSAEYLNTVQGPLTEQIVIPARWISLPDISLCFEIPSLRLNRSQIGKQSVFFFKKNHYGNQIRQSLVDLSKFLVQIFVGNGTKTWNLAELIKASNYSMDDAQFMHREMYCLRVPWQQQLPPATPLHFGSMIKFIGKDFKLLRVLVHLPDSFPSAKQLTLSQLYFNELVVHTVHTMRPNVQFDDCRPNRRAPDRRLMHVLYQKMIELRKAFSVIPLPPSLDNLTLQSIDEAKELEVALAKHDPPLDSTSLQAECEVNYQPNLHYVNVNLGFNFRLVIRFDYWHTFNMMHLAPGWIEISLNLASLVGFWLGFCMFTFCHNLQRLTQRRLR
jgi:hypothetical protein